MTFDKFTELFTILYNQNKIQNEFIDSLPHSISQAFFDNEYTNSLGYTCDKVLQICIPSAILEDVYYFLYEHKSGNEITVDKTVYKLVGLMDILKYFKEVHFLT